MPEPTEVEPAAVKIRDTDSVWGRWHLYAVSLNLFALACIADALSTIYSVNNGGREVDPLFSGLVNAFGPRVLFLTAAVGVLSLWALVTILQSFNWFFVARAVVVLIFMGVAVHTFAAIHNVEGVWHKAPAVVQTPPGPQAAGPISSLHGRVYS